MGQDPTTSPTARIGNPAMVKNLRNESGFTLVQVLVTIALVGGVALMISNMMLNANRQAKSVESKGDFNSFVNTIQSALNNSDACLAALGGSGTTQLRTDIAPNNPQRITLILGGTTYGSVAGAGVTTNYGSLRISKLQFNDRRAGAAPNQWIVPVLLEVDRSQGGVNAVGGSLIQHNFELVLTVDNAIPDPGIIFCAGQFENLWGQTGNDIFYNRGRVGIGLGNPTFTLDVAGTVRSGTYLYNSDARLKKNVRTVDDALDRVLQLRGVTYQWKRPEHDTPSGDQIGLIAQEVERVFPEAVITDPSSGLKSVSYGNLVSPLIEAIKQQHEIIEQQRREIDEIKRSLAGTRSRTSSVHERK